MESRASFWPCEKPCPAAAPHKRQTNEVAESFASIFSDNIVYTQKTGHKVAPFLRKPDTITMVDHGCLPDTKGISDQFKQTLTAIQTPMNRMVSQEASGCMG